jgi:UDP-N-acetylmuramate dehydrogenase
MPGSEYLSKRRAKFPGRWCSGVRETYPGFKKHLRDLREGGEPEIHERVDLRAWTALGIGGQADLLVRCRTAGGVQRVIDLLATHGLPWLVLGAGSRLVPCDRGLRIPVLNLSGNLGLWELDLDGVVAGGGANLAQVCRAAARAGLSGLEWFAFSSGSVGGAVQAAVAGQRSFRQVLDWVDLARPGASVERIRIADRSRSRGDADHGLELDRRVALRARIRLAGDDLSAINARLQTAGRRKLRHQPRSTSPVFADPKGGSAASLLESAGCAGMSAGGVRISERFPNHVEASRTARSEHVVELCRRARQRVLEATGTKLEYALCFVDEDGRALEP